MEYTLKQHATNYLLTNSNIGDYNYDYLFSIA